MKTVVVPVSKLKDIFFVRKELNQERVLSFAHAIEEKVEFPPIEVTTDFEVLRGRHRKQAYIFKGYDAVPVVVIPGLKTQKEKFNYALQADLVSALPQSRADIAMIIKSMMSSGQYNEKEIKDTLGRYPGAKGILHQVKQNAVNLRAAAAKRFRDENDGCSYQSAADKFDVPIDVLKSLYDKREKPYFRLSRELDKLNKHYGKTQANLLRKAREAYEVGSLTEAQTVEFLRKTGTYGRQVHANAEDAIARFAALVATDMKAAA